MGGTDKIITNGLVLKASDYRENDRLITVLSEDLGKITVIGKGVKSLRNANRPGTRELTYSEFVLNDRGGVYVLSECAPKKSFPGLSGEYEAMVLACYVASVADFICMEGAPEPEILSLSLNTLYALSERLRGYECIKAVFELRAALALGILPGFEVCSVCGRRSDDMWFSLQNGDVICRNCVKKYDGSLERLSRTALDYLRYESRCDGKKILSIPEEPDGQTAALAEKILTNGVGRTFPPLKNYNELKKGFNFPV